MREILELAGASLPPFIGDEGDALLVDFIEDKDSSPVEEVDGIVQREELVRAAVAHAARARHRRAALRLGLGATLARSRRSARSSA